MTDNKGNKSTYNESNTRRLNRETYEDNLKGKEILEEYEVDTTRRPSKIGRAAKVGAGGISYILGILLARLGNTLILIGGLIILLTLIYFFGSLFGARLDNTVLNFGGRRYGATVNSLINIGISLVAIVTGLFLRAIYYKSAENLSRQLEK